MDTRTARTGHAKSKLKIKIFIFRLEDSLERNLTNQISKSLQAPLQTEMKKFHLVQQNSQLQVNQLFGQMRQLLVTNLPP